MAAAAAFAALAASGFAQNPAASIEITSPANGAVVAPGESLTVVVATPASFARGVAVIGAGGMGFGGPSLHPPFRFTLTVPAGARPGPYRITALGSDAPGSISASASVTVDVERPDAPTALSAQPAEIQFESVGERTPIKVTGAFSDGTTTDLTNSSRVHYSASDPGVAKVDSNGMVAAVSAGSATVTAAYGSGPQASVKVTVLPSAVALSAARLDFPGQLVGTASEAQTLTLTNGSDSNLSVLGVTADGDFTESSDCGVSSPLAPAETCAIEVRSKPRTAGSREGELEISTDAVIAPTVVALQGLGQDFSLALDLHSPATATVRAGEAAAYRLQATPEGKFNRTVALACAWVGQQPAASRCSVEPASVTLDGSHPWPIRINVNTTARSLAFPAPRFPLRAPLASLFVLLLCWAAMRRTIPRSWMLMMVALSIVLAASCGGGAGISREPGTGTGAYRLTVTGVFQSGAVTLTHSVNLTLTVH